MNGSGDSADRPRSTKLTRAASAAALLAFGAPAEAQDRRSSLAPKNMQAIAPALADYTDNVLFGDVWVRPGLSPRDRSVVTLAVLIATGKSAQLAGHLGRGLDNGIRPGEIAGMATHLAFYSGWPNAVSALNVIEQVFAERKIDLAALRRDVPAPSVAPVAGTPLATRADERTATVAPKLAELTDRVLFGSLWRRSDLSPRDRSLVTIAALAANEDHEQLGTDLRRALENGLTQAELGEAISHLAFYAGWPKALAAADVARRVVGHADAATAGTAPTVQVIPAGLEPRPGPDTNFTGTASVTSAFRGTGGAQLGGGTVTFQPGARTNWHVHPLGQLLIVTAGRGWVQAAGEAAQAINPGDTVWIAPGVKHWHGATKDSVLTHVAVAESLEGESVAWLEPVKNDAYSRL